MKSYIFQSDLYCEECGEDIANGLREAGEAPEDEQDESSYDSDKFPKGPRSVGEADSPQCCGACLTFLQNPLTEEGYEYVREQTDYLSVVEPGDSEYTLAARLSAQFREINRPALAEWCDYYPEAFDTAEMRESAYVE